MVSSDFEVIVILCHVRCESVLSPNRALSEKAMYSKLDPCLRCLGDEVIHEG